MQDEVNTKVVAIAIKGGRITAEVLKKALAKFIEEIEKAEKQASQPKTYRGKQSIKHLVEQNAAISNIEVTDGNIKSFERTANKYGIDYALKKDSHDGFQGFVQVLVREGQAREALAGGEDGFQLLDGGVMPVSYTHLDVYKRQHSYMLGEQAPFPGMKV